MRCFVWTDGTPGYIAAEVAIRELSGSDEARGWAEDWWTPLPSQRIITRSEALMRPTYREALEAWERQDDSVMQEAEVTEIRASRRSEAAYFADLGCRDAAAAIAANDDEQIRVVVNEHAHDQRCGGPDFPDEPRRRTLSVVT